MRCPGVWTVVLAAVVAAAPTLAQETASGKTDPIGPNVRLTLTVRDDDDAGKDLVDRKYRLVARAGAAPAELLMGWRTPIPTSRAASGNDGENPVTSYVYQNIGVTTVLEVKILPDGRLLVNGQVEISGHRQPQQTGVSVEGAPVIGTFQQSLNVLLEPDKRLEIAEVPDPEGGSLLLMLEANVLD